jgi:hypothetical protein
MEVRNLIFGMTKGAATAALKPQPVAAAKHRRSFRPALAIIFALTSTMRAVLTGHWESGRHCCTSQSAATIFSDPPFGY